MKGVNERKLHIVSFEFKFIFDFLIISDKIGLCATPT